MQYQFITTTPNRKTAEILKYLGDTTGNNFFPVATNIESGFVRLGTNITTDANGNVIVVANPQ